MTTGRAAFPIQATVNRRRQSGAAEASSTAPPRGSPETSKPAASNWVASTGSPSSRELVSEALERFLQVRSIRLTGRKTVDDETQRLARASTLALRSLLERMMPGRVQALSAERNERGQPRYATEGLAMEGVAREILDRRAGV